MFEKQNSHVYFTGEKDVKVFLITGSQSALVIDTAYGLQGELKKKIEAFTRLPYKVVCTHNHRDHRMGNDLFDEVFMSAEDARVLADQCYSLKIVAEGDLFHLGNLSVEVISLPGHTEGSIGLYIRETGELFSGDVVNTVPSYMFSEDYRQVIKSLQKIKTLSPKRIYGSHGQNPVPFEYIDKFISIAEKRLQNAIPFKVTANPVFPDKIIYEIFEDKLGYRELHEKLQYRMFVTDLDGTLFAGGSVEITEVTRNVLRRLSERGISIVVNTGRPYVNVPMSLRKISDFVVSSNGSMITDRQGEAVYTRTIESDIVGRVYRYCKKNKYMALFYIDGNQHFEPEMFECLNCQLSDTERSYFRMVQKNGEKCDDILNYIKKYHKGVQKIMIAVNESVREQVSQDMKMLRDNVFVTHSSRSNVEITSVLANKGIAVEYLASKTGIDIGQVIAAGDSENDMQMFEHCGFSIAPVNAIDMIKDKANLICDSADNDGVVSIIERLLLNYD